MELKKGSIAGKWELGFDARGNMQVLPGAWTASAWQVKLQKP